MDKSVIKQQKLADREAAFIQATRQQICQNGLLGVQMAAIARECGYATGTLYHHFASKEDLLMAVATQITDDRRRYFERVFNWSAPSRDRMVGFTVASCLFAQHYPEQFRLEQYLMTEVIWQACTDDRREQFLAALRPLGEMAAQIVQDAEKSGDVDAHGQVPMAIVSGQWAMTNGTQTLIHAHGMLAQYQLHDPFKMLLRNVNLQLNALNWLPLCSNPFDDVALQRKVTDVCDACFADECAQYGGLSMASAP